MFKKLVWLVCVILACGCLGGCQLAKEYLGPGEDQSQDKIIGVYVTFTHLPSDEAIYAKEILVVEEDGYETTTFKFEDIPGIAFFEATVMGEDEFHSYKTTISDPEIFVSQITIHFNSEVNKLLNEDILLEDLEDFTITENNEVITLTGTLYALENTILYISNVFQSPEGEVYMRAGAGYYISDGTMSTSLDETSKDGKFTLKLTLTVEMVDPPEQEIVKEMNDRDEVIRATVITPDNIPDSISLHPDCAYTIVETHSRSDEGIVVSRILLDPDVECYIYKYPGERGFLIWKTIAILPWDD